MNISLLHLWLFFSTPSSRFLSFSPVPLFLIFSFFLSLRQIYSSPSFSPSQITFFHFAPFLRALPCPLSSPTFLSLSQRLSCPVVVWYVTVGQTAYLCESVCQSASEKPRGYTRVFTFMYMHVIMSVSRREHNKVAVLRFCRHVETSGNIFRALVAHYVYT
jgi:hypothetical protein